MKLLRKYLFLLFIVFIFASLAWGMLYLIVLRNKSCVVEPSTGKRQIPEQKSAFHEACTLLKAREDNSALLIFGEILKTLPDNNDALWGKAEVFRRQGRFEESEQIIKDIFSRDKHHKPSIISLCYIYCSKNRLKEALVLLQPVLSSKPIDNETLALAWVMLGTINSKKIQQAGLFRKITYVHDIRCCFEKAVYLAPDLAEPHLALGTFYYSVPRILGGNLNKAIDELMTALTLAPDFATVNARLAQCYKKKGLKTECEFYYLRAKKLDPGNEILKEFSVK